MKGVSLVPKTVVVLSLDGSLVYVEAIEQTHAAVVALPEQLPVQSEHGQRVFTAGRVGAKKISPFSSADKEVPIAELSERNRKFIDQYEKLRDENGPNYVDRTPEEQAAYDLAMAGPQPKAKKARLTDEEKLAAKEAKKKNKGPRFLQKCATCGEQPGHPNHPDVHPFEAPPPPAILCAACDEPETADVHAKDKADGGHRFIMGKVVLKPRAPKEPKPDVPRTSTRAPRTSGKKDLDVNTEFKWVGTDEQLAIMAAGNPKYQPKNSGRAIIEAIKSIGNASQTAVAASLAGRWDKVTPSRLALAFGQLLDAKLIEAV